MLDKRKIKTRRDIEQALLTLLTKKSFRQITVNDICEKSLTSRSTFYDHYDDKYDLLNRLVDRYTQEFKVLASEKFNQVVFSDDQRFAISQITNPLLEDREAINVLLNIHEDQMDLFRNWQNILIGLWSHGLDQVNIVGDVPKDYLIKVNTDIVLDYLIWSLDHNRGNQDAVNLVRKMVVQTFKGNGIN